MQGNWDGYTDADMLRPGHDVAEHHRRKQRALHQHLQHRARWHGRRRSSTPATSSCATPTFSTAASAPAARPLACLASGAPTAPTATTPTTPSRISASTTGIRSCRWSRRSPRVHGFTFRNIWALDQPPLAASTITGNVTDVTFDNVKYGQNRATNERRNPLWSRAAAPRSQSSPAPTARWRTSPLIRPSLRPGDQVTFTADASPARALSPGSSATDSTAMAAA